MPDITAALLGQQNQIGYSALLPLIYIVPTFFPTAPGAVTAQGGAPVVDLEDPDLQARAQRLVNVLYWTAEQYKNQPGMNDDKTLKVFMAPEFYFRKPYNDPNLGYNRSTDFGTYPENARAALAEALFGVIGNEPKFKDWVIVAGTICSRMSGPKLNLLNTAIMMRGPRERADASVRCILMEKHYFSHIDFMPEQWNANRDPSTVYSFDLNPDQYLDNLIHWDNMTLGLEVCLDHSKQVAVNGLNILQQSIGPQVPPLNLQLVTSCGMSIVNQAVAVADGALVMLTDGYTPVNNLTGQVYGPYSQIGRYDADKHAITLIPDSDFLCTPLPSGADYCVDYCPGRYVGVQGICAGKAPIPMYE